MGGDVHVAGSDRGPCVLKHKYHRHWNHGRPRVGYWGVLGVPSIEPFEGGVRPEGSIDTPLPQVKARLPIGLSSGGDPMFLQFSAISGPFLWNPPHCPDGDRRFRVCGGLPCLRRSLSQG